MSHPYMPFFPGDFLRDCSDLNATERGIYISLLWHAFNNHGKIPLEKGRLSRITACHPRLWKRWGEPIMARFWHRNADGISASNTRLCTVLHRSDENVSKNKARASQARSVDGRYTKPNKNRDLFYSEPRGDLLYAGAGAKPMPAATPELRQLVSGWKINGNGHDEAG